MTRNRFIVMRALLMSNGPETCRHAHISLSRVQRGAQQWLMAQLEHFRITTAALRLTTAHTDVHAVVGTQVGHPRSPHTVTAAVVVRQPGLTVSVLVSSKGGRSRSDCTSAVHDTNSTESEHLQHTSRDESVGARSHRRSGHEILPSRPGGRQRVQSAWEGVHRAER